jgi:hypothetical protein
MVAEIWSRKSVQETAAGAKSPETVILPRPKGIYIGLSGHMGYKSMAKQETEKDGRYGFQNREGHNG